MKITISLSYYNQSDALLKHIELWKTYPKEILNNVVFYVMDDCSKVPAQEILKNVDIDGLNIHIYRVEVDLYCNISGVRNLSAQECKTDWMLILDMDTLVPKKMIVQLFNLIKLDKKKIAYKFNRLCLDNKQDKRNYKIHPAVCLIRKEDYWHVGGCEEDLVGHYGGTDPTFFWKAKDKITLEICQNIFLIHLYEGEADIVRDVSHNTNLFEQRKKDGKWSTDYVRFPWKKVL